MTTPTPITTLAALVGKPLPEMTTTELLRGMATVCLLDPESASVDRAAVYSSIMREGARRDEEKVQP